MRAASHVSIAKAEIRGRAVARHRALRLDGGRTHVLAGGLGFPRLWGYATDWALAGFEEGFNRTKKVERRLDEGMEVARNRVAARCEELIERELPDAFVTCVDIDGDLLNVRSVGPGRVYLHRHGEPNRLTSRQESDLGILHGSIKSAQQRLQPDDVVMAGSVSAFSVKAIAQVAVTLKSDPQTPPSILATLLTGPAGETGVGGVAVVMRIR